MNKVTSVTQGQVYTVPKNIRLFPMTKRTSMRYVWSSEATQLDIPAGNFYIQNFNGNGLFDPDRTGVGNQPRGFDDAMAFYSSYKVLGSSITVTYQQIAQTIMTSFAIYPQTALTTDQSNQYPFVGLLGSDFFAAAGDTPRLSELGQMKICNLPHVLEGGMVTMTRKAKTSSVIRVSETDKSRLVGDITKNPESTWVWSVLVGNDAAALQSNIAVLKVVIVYDVLLSERDLLLQS